jgi:hypothetical protein
MAGTNGDNTSVQRGRAETQLRLTIGARTNGARRGAEELVAKTPPLEIEWPADWPVESIPTEAEADAVLDDCVF